MAQSTRARSAPFVIAIDSGGTHSRVACVGVDGALLAASTGRGGSPYHDADGAENVTTAVADCLASGGLQAENASAIVAGMAAMGRPGSNQGSEGDEWAARLFDLPGLRCPRTVVNDATTAHRGALLGAPGIVVIAGTGSMILGIDERGAEIESGRFEHYAGAARHLAFETVQLVLTGAAVAADADLVAAVLAHWDAHGVEQLRRRLLALSLTDLRDVRRRYGALAPVVTAAADVSPLADHALRELVRATARGVRLLLPLIAATPVPVVVVGSLATTAAFRDRLGQALEAEEPGRASIVPAVLGPLGGAALMALETVEALVSERVVAALRAVG